MRKSLIEIETEFAIRPSILSLREGDILVLKCAQMLSMSRIVSLQEQIKVVLQKAGLDQHRIGVMIVDGEMSFEVIRFEERESEGMNKRPDRAASE